MRRCCPRGLRPPLLRVSRSYVTPARRRTVPAEYGPADFPGCEPFHLPASELDRYEGRLEFWDGRTGTAWKVREPTSTCHERPSHRLAGLVREIEVLRGSQLVECLGAADLVRLDAAGRKLSLIQADQVLYLHTDRSRVQGPAIDVDTDPLPDVVLEVDHTTVAPAVLTR